MQPYDPCEACIAMQAAALAYQAAAQAEQWVQSNTIADGVGADCGARCQAAASERTTTSSSVNQQAGGCNWKCKARGGLKAVGGAAEAVGSGIENGAHAVNDAVHDYCGSHDCTQMIITTTAISITVVGVVTLQPEVAVAGMAIYSLDVQYNWQEYRQGEKSSGDVWASVLGPVPGIAAGEEAGPVMNLALSGYDLVRDAVTSEGDGD
jgi:hypothetical protein